MADPPRAAGTERRPIRVLDLINTSESAKELLLDRALYLSDQYGVECGVDQRLPLEKVGPDIH